MRPSVRLSPRLEVLEARRLLSRGYPGSGSDDDGASLPGRGPTVAEKRVASNGINPGGVDRARAQYVIVPEQQAAHQTLATAQKLPDLPYFGVVGTIGSGDPIDLYRLTLNAGTIGLNFGLASDPSAATIPMQLQVFDESGQVLGAWSLGGPGTGSIHAGLGAQPAGSTLYFGITAGNPGGAGGASTPIGYHFWVDIQSQSATAGSTTAPRSGTLGASAANLPAVASPVPTATGPGASTSSGTEASTPTAPPEAAGGMRVAVGSAATRSAGPSGGLLSEGDPAPAVASDFHAAVNKDWDGSSLNGTNARSPDAVEPTELARRETGPDALVVLHGPGGFPLLGAVALGHRRGNLTTDLDEIATATGPALPAVSDPPSSEDTITAQSRPFHDRPWGRFSVPIISGLGLATVFTLNAVLSQPMAGFDYLSSHLDPDDGTPPYRRDRKRAGPRKGS